MSPRKFVIPALLVGSGLLSGYTQTPTGITWVYHGTPLVTHPYDLSTGKPTIAEFSATMPGFLPALPADLKSKVSYSLPEGRDIRLNAQGLVPDTDDKTNIRMAKDGEVWVTFVSEGAGYRNSVGYFIYDPAKPPKSPTEVQEKIIFANASMPSPLDAASTTKQNTVSLGVIPAGKALGFMIVSDGFSATGRTFNGSKIAGVKESASPKWVFYTLRGLNPEAASIQNLNVHTVMLKDASNASDGYQRLVIGFEDINRESGGDHDFNDVVLAIHVTPRTAIANIDTLQTLVGASDPDTDGDGVKDSLDEFPADKNRAFSRYYPDRNTFGTLAFEDQWPSRGDYDLNDVVMRYRTREIMNAARGVVALELDYKMVARGGIVDSGFGIHLPGIAASLVKSATLSVNGAQAVAATVESGQTDAVFVVMPSSLSAMPVPSGSSCSFANTVNTCAAVAPVTYTLSVEFTTPQVQTLFTSPYNPFIFRKSTRGQEVHLPGKPGTKLANTALYGTSDDRTKTGTANTYMDSARRPWALDIPVEWVHPKENTDISKAYPKIIDWAKNSGTVNRDWYNLPSTQFLYKAP